jgi:plastocyanin
VGRLALVASLLVCAARSALAEDVDGTVRLLAVGSTGGTPLQGQVVVYLTGFQQAPPDEVPVISQKDKVFVPNLRVIVAGQSVRFTNDDAILHSVFSTSKARPFDIGKPPPGEAREVRFPTPGLVDIYCNIHEEMWAAVLVLPNRAFAIADAQGRFVLHGVPPGRYPLHAWGWKIDPLETEIVVLPGKPAHVDLGVNAHVFSASHLDKFGRPYGGRSGYSP